MAKARARMNLRGINRLMRSDPVQREVNKAAGRVAAAAGPKFQVHPSKHRWVARAFIEPRQDVRVTHADRERLLAALDSTTR